MYFSYYTPYSEPPGLYFIPPVKQPFSFELFPPAAFNPLAKMCPPTVVVLLRFFNANSGGIQQSWSLSFDSGSGVWAYLLFFN